MALVITQFQYFFRFSDGLTSFLNYFPPLPLWLFLALNCVEISTRCAPCYFTQFKVKFDTLIYCWPVYDSLIFSSRLQFECHFDLSVLTFSVHFVRISVYLFNEVVNTLPVNGVERYLLTYLLTNYLSRFVKVCPIVVEVSGIFCQIVIHKFGGKGRWKSWTQIGNKTPWIHSKITKYDV